MNRSEIRQKIFNSEASNFLSNCLDVFQYQYKNNPVYRSFCEHRNANPENVFALKDIPFLPISFFKTHEVKCSTKNPMISFSSSGSTGITTSKHHLFEEELYIESFTKSFERIYGSVQDYCILGLLPNYLERSGSSLIYMVNHFIEKSNDARSAFVLYNQEDLCNTLNDLAKTKTKTLLIGVSFALLDFIEHFQVDFNEQLIVMETGGMKGRKKELVRADLHQQLKKSFGLEQIHSEYGMTELLSQAYAIKDGLFITPPWMSLLIRQADDPFSWAKEKHIGGINVIDLANLDSCSFIQTDDLGKKNEKEEVEILGRFDQSELRGCNLLLT